MVKFRPITEADIPEIGTWILAEPDHAERMDASFYTQRRDGSVSFAIDDEQGTVMYVRQDAEPDFRLRLHTDFPPNSKQRVAQALAEAYPLVAEDAKLRGFKEIIFDSASVPLTRFMTRFGFKAELRHQLS